MTTTTANCRAISAAGAASAGVCAKFWGIAQLVFTIILSLNIFFQSKTPVAHYKYANAISFFRTRADLWRDDEKRKKKGQNAIGNHTATRFFAWILAALFLLRAAVSPHTLPTSPNAARPTAAAFIDDFLPARTSSASLPTSP